MLNLKREFGEKIEGYVVPVLNENEARGAAFILFTMVLIGLVNCMHGSTTMAYIIAPVFAIDFFIRIFISYKWAPSMIIARMFTQKIKPQYTGAAQKQYAWTLGLIMGIVMTVVVYGSGTLWFESVLNPAVALGCFTCLFLLGMEAGFAICIGCKMRKFFVDDFGLQDCPDGKCFIYKPTDKEKLKITQFLFVIAFLLAVIGSAKIFS